MAENDKFETLGDAFAKYPQSTLIMRKQYVDEKDATIADLQKTNATIANNAVTMNRKIDILEAEKKNLESKYIDRLEEAENQGVGVSMLNKKTKENILAVILAILILVFATAFVGWVFSLELPIRPIPVYITNSGK